MKNSFEILEFLMEQDGFVNEHGVSFIAIDDLIHFAVPLSKDHCLETISVELCGLAEAAFFSSIFACQSHSDLHFITREGMMRLYDAGICYVSCLVDEEQFGGEMEFRRNVRGTTVMDVEGQSSHLTSLPLVCFEDFAQYASKYFLLQADSNPLYPRNGKN